MTAPPDELAKLVERLREIADNYGGHPKDTLDALAAEFDTAIRSLTEERDRWKNAAIYEVSTGGIHLWSEIAKKRDAERVALTARVGELEAALRDLIEGVVPEVNEKGAGGFLLARLTDARNALRGVRAVEQVAGD